MTKVERQLRSVIAVDLGSNSFHLLEAYWKDGELCILTALQQKVQLSLNMQNGVMSAVAIERGLETLRCFAPFTRGRPPSCVCIVGTQALRLAKNSESFCKSAEEILGHPISIISGEQEAELVYEAVTYDMESESHQLVIDIGGGSTELALGCGHKIVGRYSLPVGCVSLLKHFPGGVITQVAMDNAYKEARQYFQPIVRSLEDRSIVIGCSGTLAAVDEVLSVLGWSQSGISRSGLAALKSKLITFHNIEAIQLNGLSVDRRSVFVPGVAIVLALFDSFSIDHMDISSKALREGVALRVIASTSKC